MKGFLVVCVALFCGACSGRAVVSEELEALPSVTCQEVRATSRIGIVGNLDREDGTPALTFEPCDPYNSSSFSTSFTSRNGPRGYDQLCLAFYRQ
jgi:hypothetical protein